MCARVSMCVAVSVPGYGYLYVYVRAASGCVSISVCMNQCLCMSVMSMLQRLASDRGAGLCVTSVAGVQPALVAGAKLPCTFVIEVCQVIITCLQWSQSGWH